MACSTKLRFIPGFLVLSLLLCGCGHEDAALRTYHIQGTVTLDGEPVPVASIQLIDPSGRLRTCVARVTDGVLTGESTAGEKQLEVTAFRIAANKTIPGADGTGSEPATEQYLPAKYNTATILTANIEPKEGTTLNLELVSK